MSLQQQFQQPNQAFYNSFSNNFQRILTGNQNFQPFNLQQYDYSKESNQQTNPENIPGLGQDEKYEGPPLSIIKRDQVQTRIQVKVHSEVLKQRFMAFIDRRVHRIPLDFLRYLSQVMPVKQTSWLALINQPDVEIIDLDIIQDADVLLLKERTPEEIQQYQKKMMERQHIPAGAKFNPLQPHYYSLPLQPDNKPGEVYSDQPKGNAEFETQKLTVKQQLEALKSDQMKGEGMKGEKGEAQQPSESKFKMAMQSLVNRDTRKELPAPQKGIKNELAAKNANLEEQQNEDGKGFNAEKAKSIMEQYLLKANPTQEDSEAAYASLILLPGFVQWDKWVPMPHPHKELAFARGMYMRGEKLCVQTPDFENFSNNIKNTTSRNQLIYKVKRMCMERGFRGKLSMATITEAKSLHVIFLCDRSKKASLKSRCPSVKGLCPFLAHYERKSFIGINKGFRGEEYWEGNFEERRKKQNKLGQPLNQMYANMKGPNSGMGADDPESKEKNAQVFWENFQAPEQKKEEANTGDQQTRTQYNELLEDIDIDGDPYYLKYYRSFHNHELDTNVIQNLGDVDDKDLHRRDLINNTLPMGNSIIQHYTSERRCEIIEEGTANQFRFPFDAKSQTICKIQPYDPTSEPIHLEPPGLNPFLIFCDSSLNIPDPKAMMASPMTQLKPNVNNEDWKVSTQMLEHQRLDWLRTQTKLLSQVRTKIASGMYTLAKWRMRGIQGNQAEQKKKTERKNKGAKDKDNKLRFTNIVNKILASKTGEDCQVDSDDNRSDSNNGDNNENYNIYE